MYLAFRHKIILTNYGDIGRLETTKHMFSVKPKLDALITSIRGGRRKYPPFWRSRHVVRAFRSAKHEAEG